MQTDYRSLRAEAALPKSESQVASALKVRSPILKLKITQTETNFSMFEKHRDELVNSLCVRDEPVLTAARRENALKLKLVSLKSD